MKNDVDPAQYKKETKAIQKEFVENSFENVAREWFTKNKHIWTKGHSKTIISRLELNVFPWLGAQPVASITAPAFLDVLRRIEARGAIETTHRVKQICGRFFDMQLQPDVLNVIPAQTCEVHYRLQNQKEWQQLQTQNRLADYYEPLMDIKGILLPDVL